MAAAVDWHGSQTFSVSSAGMLQILAMIENTSMQQCWLNKQLVWCAHGVWEGNGNSESLFMFIDFSSGHS